MPEMQNVEDVLPRISSLRSPAEELFRSEYHRLLLDKKDALKAFDISPSEVATPKQLGGVSSCVGGGERAKTGTSVRCKESASARPCPKVPPRPAESCGSVWLGRGDTPRWGVGVAAFGPTLGPMKIGR